MAFLAHCLMKREDERDAPFHIAARDIYKRMSHHTAGNVPWAHGSS